MSKDTLSDTRQARWARFRFSIVGPLLSAPPKKGELKALLETLSKKTWKHPITDQPLTLSFSTLEHWFYRAKKTHDPVMALHTKRRTDAALTRKLSAGLKKTLHSQYHDHPKWSYQLHVDNLAVRAKEHSELGVMPSYSTIYRYMKAQGLRKQRRLTHRPTKGALLAQERLEHREVRSFEMEYVHSLWHLDFHHTSRKILTKDGKWIKPLLLAIGDDHSRLVCHAQWYLDETTESLVHGFMQALQKRGLPRALMTDNGAAMISAEFTQGLERLGILHQPTLSYSPYQNGKQEVLWGQVEGRLMAMLEGESDLSLSLLNEATIAWVEFEYHRKVHSEILTTPLERFLQGKSVGRPCPDKIELQQAFCAQVKRKQRHSDGTFTLEGRRFEVPSQYRHFDVLHIRYRRWDLSQVMLVDPQRNVCLAPVYPQDKSANASGKRRSLAPRATSTSTKPQTSFPTPQSSLPSQGIAPLLKKLMADYAATGLPPAYLPQKKGKNS